MADKTLNQAVNNIQTEDTEEQYFRNIISLCDPFLVLQTSLICKQVESHLEIDILSSLIPVDTTQSDKTMVELDKLQNNLKRENQEIKFFA